MDEPKLLESTQNSDESSGPASSADRRYSIAEFSGHLAPLVWPPGNASPPVPAWPPDLFAIVGSILEESGAYTQAVVDWPPPFTFDASDLDQEAIDELEMAEPEDWGDWIKLLGWSWRKSWKEEDPHPPGTIAAWWNQVVSLAATPITEVREQPLLCKALLQLLAVSDEACFGLGTGYLTRLSDLKRLPKACGVAS